MVHITIVRHFCIVRASELEVGRDTRWNVAPKTHSERFSTRFYLSCGIKDHLSQGPANFNIINLVHGPEWVPKALFLRVLQDFLGTVMASWYILQTDSRNPNAFMKNV